MLESKEGRKMPGKPKHVLAIMGSPRKGGNTDIMVDEIIAGAKEAGATVEKLMIGDLNIEPCEACAACRTTGECIKQDDMKVILEKLKDDENKDEEKDEERDDLVEGKTTEGGGSCCAAGGECKTGTGEAAATRCR